MKKLLCLLLTLAMTLSLAACGSKADDKTPEEDDPTQAETNIADKQDADKDNASDATEIDPDANKGEKPDEAQKPAKPTKSDSKKDETPASKPSEPAKPAEPSKPAETPSETPAAQDTGALSLLTSVWSTYSEDDKFPVDGAPGSFDVSNADNLTYQLTFPSADVSLIDGAASLVHMMNLNTFTCGAFHVSDADNVSTVAADIRSAVQGKQWMCGFPERLVILTSGQYVVSVYGNESLVNTFRDKFVAAHSGASTVYDEAIGA